jgi:hypothetical protein
MPTQTPIVFLHFIALGVLYVLYRMLRQKAVGRVLWTIGFASAALCTIGLLLLFVFLILTPAGFIHPLAFAGGFAIALIAYGGVTALYFSTRPTTPQATPGIWLISTLGVIVLNGVWILSPVLLSRTVTLVVLGHDGQPISSAEFEYKGRSKPNEKKAKADSKGHISISLPYMATIEGTITAPDYAEHSLYIAPNQRISGRGLSVIQKTQTKFLGDIPPVGGMFLYTTPFHFSFEIFVYLQKIGEGFPLPFPPIADLAAHLKEAQYLQGNYPFVLKSGDIFNPEMKAQSVDAYRQLPAIINAYDPKAPLRHYANDYWNYFKSANDTLQDRLQKIDALPESDRVKQANAVILAELLGEYQQGQDSHALLRRVEARLERDRQLLKEVNNTYKKNNS